MIWVAMLANKIDAWWLQACCGLLLVVGLVLGTVGCASLGGGRDAVDELHLLTIPVAINADGVAGADGFAIKVYASRYDEPKPVSIASGQIEILMYDGVVRIRDLATTAPLRTWVFANATLRDCQYRTSIGVGYQFALQWGTAKPTGDHITVLARYRSRDGRIITSLPGSISTRVE